MSKVLVIARVFPPQVGGSGRFLWEIYRRQHGLEVTVAAGQFPGDEAHDRASALPTVRLPLQFRNWGLAPLGFWSYVATFLRLRRLVRRRGVQSVHAATLLPEGFLAWMLQRTNGLPYLCYVHGEELAVVSMSRELSWMADRVMAGAARIIANSLNTRDLIAKQWPALASKVSVVTPGVDIERFRPTLRDEVVREQLGWAGRRVVLTAGRFQERKGHDRLIEALPAIRSAIPDILYAIVGDGDRRKILKDLVQAHGVEDCVKFHGELTDDRLVECFQQCDLMALPNREVAGDIEGFGMVLVEAQACGRPVLAGASGGAPETIRPGVSGQLVNGDRWEPLAAAVIEMMGDAARLDEMGAAAREWAVGRFDWRLIVEQASEAFELALTPRDAAKSRENATLCAAARGAIRSGDVC